MLSGTRGTGGRHERLKDFSSAFREQARRLLHMTPRQDVTKSQTYNTQRITTYKRHAIFWPGRILDGY